MGEIQLTDANNKSRNNIAKVSERARAEPIQPNLYHTFTGFWATVCYIVYCVLWPNGWMDQGATCYGDTVLWGPSSSPKKGGTAAPSNFSAKSIVAKRLERSSCHLVRREDSAQAALC